MQRPTKEQLNNADEDVRKYIDYLEQRVLTLQANQRSNLTERVRQCD